MLQEATEVPIKDVPEPVRKVGEHGIRRMVIEAEIPLLDYNAAFEFVHPENII